MRRVDLVCIDVDGTLLDSTGAVPDEVWDALGELRERGVRQAICSGRPAFGVTAEYARRLDPAGWHIFQNGASVVRLDTGETRSMAIPRPVVERTVAAARRTGRVLELYTDYDVAAEQDADRARRHAELLGVPFRPRAFETLQGPVVRAQWLIPHEEREAVLAEPHEGLNLCPSLAPLMPDTTFVNMTAAGVHKGSALARVAAAYGIPLERVMMVGDGENDIGAMRIAGLAVAMGNAEAAALEAADVTVGHVDEGGLLEALALVG
ncbi:MAG: Cof-type HAD-IIB family hydrolase [Burkholderiales bacterium]|nr:Cof-type HAD-IIB family hydrolase [Burkholderiales bacterium]PZN00823.1 MAG: Cof-type HAD-IIB family hydrolase [Pseudomonadota bacterium]